MKKLFFFLINLVIVSCSTETLSTISLDTTDLTIEVAETYTFKVTYSPSDINEPVIYWHSSDSNVATVENGTVTGCHVGNAIIRAYVNQIPYAYCNISVIPVTVKNITLILI